MARRSQCSSAGDNPLNPNYLAPHYREEYRLAIDALIEEDLKGYYDLLQKEDVVDFLSTPEIQHIQSSVQLPWQGNQPERNFLESDGESSSDTYWPMQSDMEAPGLDLGWPHLHRFNGPAEVTTLINPPEYNMPSIKEQARRLIKNAQLVIAIVMDMFTDVDIFADILNAAMRNVAVYIILDKQNAHHFTNMVSNCRVNLQSIQFLRVRTASGLKYHCCTGKSFRGQMMDRFLLTDCRAVLSGNYSFMWSFEKIHRCMAHLFLGQLVSTFDEEFRILYALSEPLITENVPGPVEDFNPLQMRQYPHEKTPLYRDPKKFHPDDESRDMDWRMMPLKKQESIHSSYSWCPSQQSPRDPFFDQGHSRMPMMENPACSGYDKLWSQDKSSFSADEYSEPVLPQEMEPPDNFDPVLNYLLSTRNVEFDQGSEKLLPASSSYPRRLSLGQMYACQTSPTPSNPTDQKQFFQEHYTDQKDPMVKRGLRNLRISSYLSALDNPGDERLPPEEPSNPPIQQKAPGICFSVPKIPQFREFKVPTLRRASQLPSYVKPTAREQSKKLPDESTAVAAETKTTPTPSESSSTAEGDKTEEAEPKEPKTSVPRREESFRRKYNVAVPRSSRLRSSLIFSSLEQDTQTAAGQQGEEGDKDDAEQTKVPFVSQFLGQKKSTAREPFEWSRYRKSATFDSSAPETSKPDDETSKGEEKDSSSKDENSKNPSGVQESLKPSDVEQGNISPSMPQSKPSEGALPKTDQLVQPHKSLLTPLYADMSDPDERLLFFKELAAKRKAAKAAEAEKGTEKTPMKALTDLKDNKTVKKKEPVPNEASEKNADMSVKKQSKSSKRLSVKTATAEDAGKTISIASFNVSDKTKNQDTQVNNDPNTSKSCEEEQTRVSTDSEKIELKNSQSAASLPVSAETEAPQSEPREDPKLSKPAVKECSPCQSPTTTNETPANVPSLAQGTDKSENTLPDSSSQTTPSPTASSFAPLSTTAETVSSNVTTEDSNSTPTSSILSSVSHKIETQESVSPSPPESQKDAPESENSPVAEESSCVVLASPKDVKAGTTPPIFSSSSPESCLPSVSNLESSHSKPDQKKPITPIPTPADPPPDQSETSSLVSPDIPPDDSQSETSARPQDAPTRAHSPPEHNLTGCGSPTPAETVSCSPLSESVGSVTSPEAEKTDTKTPVLHSSSDTNSLSSETPTDSNKASTHPSTESSSSPTEPTSIITSVTSVTTEPDLPSKTPESVTSESHTKESPVPADNNSNIDNQIEVSKEPELPEPLEKKKEDTEATSKVNTRTTKESNDQERQSNCSDVAEVASDEVIPLSPQSKKPKSSHYHSSTAKVLSSSNLRDDTKLLLGQISANSQSRNESSKAFPVTDDEKEDKADKHAKRTKERGFRSLTRARPKSAQERKELLEKIQSMRKDRKVYSRFEMAP